jgi:hypothetical protein
MSWIPIDTVLAAGTLIVAIFSFVTGDWWVGIWQFNAALGLALAALHGVQIRDLKRRHP